jgi:hypothetical protein
LDLGPETDKISFGDEDVIHADPLSDGVEVGAGESAHALPMRNQPASDQLAHGAFSLRPRHMHELVMLLIPTQNVSEKMREKSMPAGVAGLVVVDLLRGYWST